MIHISHKTGSIAVPFEQRFNVLFPHGKRLNYEGQELMALPHGEEETRLLRNLGFDVPAPITEHYAFPSVDGKKAFGKQVATAAHMTMHQRSFVLNAMGTGKTKSAIWAFDWLKTQGRVRSMLVVAPLSTLEFTWAKECMLTCPNLKVAVLLGTAGKRRKLFAQPADIYIINHAGLSIIRKELMKRLDVDVICLDEAAAYRNKQTDRWHIAKGITANRSYLWAMTGSPTPTAPTDAFGLARLIVPATAPTSFSHYKQDTMVQVSQYKWVPKRDAAEKVARVLQPAVRFTLDEIVELPPVVERDLRVPMGPRQVATYNMLREHAAVLLKEGTITAANAAVVYGKLLQVSLGWVYGDDGKTYELDNGAALKALLDIVTGVTDSIHPEAKVIVFSNFISATDGLARALAKEGIAFATISGATPMKERTETFTRFQSGSTIQVLNAHPECMSHGLTLTAADTIIWFGPTMKLEVYEQANARIRRIGQTRKQQIIRMMASPAERVAYDRLAKRQDLQRDVLAIIQDLTEEQP